MAPETFNIKIEGYWPESEKDKIPDHSGVYFVYEGRLNEVAEIDGILRLIYIGESDKVCDRVTKHEVYEEWRKHVRSDNTLCFSFGPLPDIHRRRVEAAYIFRHKPPENDEYRDIFPFDRTTVNSSGRIDLLDPSFTIYKT